MSEKVKNRKPLGRHITKGNFDGIDGGPDIEAVDVVDENPAIYSVEFDDSDLNGFENWSDQDFVEQHAAFQHNFRVLNPEADITPNLLGTGNEVFDLICEDKDDIANFCDKFEKKLKIENFNTKEIETELETFDDDCTFSFHESFVKIRQFAKICLDWKVLIPFTLILQIFSVSILHFMFNLLVVTLLKFAFEYVNYSKPEKDLFNDISMVRSLARNCQSGKELLLRSKHR